jgi:hypothetical protein
MCTMDAIICDLRGAPRVVTPCPASLRSTAPGGLTVKVRMTHVEPEDRWGETASTTSTLTIPTVTSFIPDLVELNCTNGIGAACSAGPNKPPVKLSIALFAGAQQLIPMERFSIDTLTPGYFDSYGRWTTSTAGLATVTARYGGLTATREFEVAYVREPGPRGLVWSEDAELDLMRN